MTHRASRELRDDDPRGLAWDPALAERQGAENVAEIACRNALAEQAVAVGLAGSPGELDPAQAELAELLLWGVQKGLLTQARVRRIAAEVREESRSAAQQAGISAVAWRKRRSRSVARLRRLRSSGRRQREGPRPWRTWPSTGRKRRAAGGRRGAGRVEGAGGAVRPASASADAEPGETAVRWSHRGHSQIWE